MIQERPKREGAHTHRGLSATPRLAKALQHTTAADCMLRQKPHAPLSSSHGRYSPRRMAVTLPSCPAATFPGRNTSFAVDFVTSRSRLVAPPGCRFHVYITDLFNMRMLLPFGTCWSRHSVGSLIVSLLQVGEPHARTTHTTLHHLPTISP